jgi:hypothetical protein
VSKPLDGPAPALDAFDELLRKSLLETCTARLAAECDLHTACLVPVAVLKAAEAAAGLALPCSCGIQLERRD